MKKVFIILCGMVLVLSSAGCQSFSRPHHREIRSEPTVVNWQPKEIFKVAEAPKKIAAEVDMGFMTVKRIKDGSLYRVAVIPFRDLPVGLTVNIVQVRYPASLFNRWLLLK